MYGIFTYIWAIFTVNGASGPDLFYIIPMSLMSSSEVAAKFATRDAGKKTGANGHGEF